MGSSRDFLPVAIAVVTTTNLAIVGTPIRIVVLGCGFDFSSFFQRIVTFHGTQSRMLSKVMLPRWINGFLPMNNAKTYQASNMVYMRAKDRNNLNTRKQYSIF